MRLLNTKQIEHLLPEFLDGDEHDDFLKLYSDSTSENKNTLLDQLLRIDSVRLESIKRTNEIKIVYTDLVSYPATGLGNKLIFRDGKFQYEPTFHKFRWYQQGRYQYQFILEEFETEAHLTVAEVFPEARGNGVFQQMLNSVFRVCFEKNNFKTVGGRAAPPRCKLYDLKVDGVAEMIEAEDDDWRSKKHHLRSKKIKLDYQPTKLMHMWLKQKYVIPASHFDPLADDNEFRVLNPKLVQDLPMTEIRKLDSLYPKPRKNRLQINNQYKKSL